MMDGLFIRTGLYGSIPVGTALDIRPGPSQFSAVGRSPAPVNAISVDKSSDSTASSSSSSSSSSKFSFNQPFRSFLFGGGNKQSPKGVALDDAVLVERQVGEEEGSVGNLDDQEGQNGNWVLKILHVKSLWSSEKQGKLDGVEVEEREREGQNGNFPYSPSSAASSSDDDHDGDGDGDDGEEGSKGCCEGCSVCDDDDDDDDDDEKGKVDFDRDSFSKLLKKVPLAEAKLYDQMSYLGNLAYCIPNIKPRNLLKRQGLRLVTSSIEKREQLALLEKKEQQQNETESTKGTQIQAEELKSDDLVVVNKESRVRTYTAFHIAASAASYLHRQTTSLLPLGSPKRGTHEGSNNIVGGSKNGDLDLNVDAEMASLMATTDSVTAVVAAKEEVKQAVADDLSSVRSSPCEWYTCDDDKTATRFFVIQGSETLASWQANLLFEPVKFEGLDVFVHRGIYEAAKGMYQQMLPEVHAHMKAHGSRAKFRFTGHSLGGSLSLLINLMLLIRGEVPCSLLLPVITFGSPCIMCGGDELLVKLGLPKSHVQAIVMHRDIVPRAFSCHYPRPAAELLKAVNGSFRNHPCLNTQKLLYSPMGEMLILQPDEKYSPQHDLLPSGSGLYLLTCKVRDATDGEKQLRAAMKAFLNRPHPLEILSDRSAYGNGGTIQRDHDMNSYLKCVRAVIRKELSQIRKADRQRRRKVWWPLVTPRVSETRIIVGPALGPTNVGQAQFNFLGVMRTGRESVRRFSRLVASQHMHLLVVLLFPARLLLIGAFTL